MKKFAGDEKPVVVVEVVLDPVGVDLAVVGVDIDVRQIQVTVVVTPDAICKISSVPPSFEYSQD